MGASAEASVEAGGVGTDAMFDYTGGVEAEGDGEGRVPHDVSDEERREMRRLSLEFNNNIRGTTGLLRISEAYSAAPGTFRMSFLSGFFSKKGFLCDGTIQGGCALTQNEAQEDKVSRVAAHLGLSVTLASFLEGFIGMHAHATSNDQGRPELLQVLGDTNWGLKAFAPKQPNQVWGVGGELELWMLNGTGGVGIDGSGTSFAMRLLSSIDLANKVVEEERVPFRAHLNLGYKFNNAGKLVEDVEIARGGDTGRVQRITRVERFGLDIDRVDTFELGLGFESPLPYVRPFLEWTFDIPVQRQEYLCNESRLDPGDGCLLRDAGFKTTPSRIGLGARVSPGLDGLNILAALEFATGGHKNFIEEVAPELPWQLHFGLAYNADPLNKGESVVKEVEVERIVEGTREPDRIVVGKVVNEDNGEPIAEAIVRYVGRNITGMVSNEDGSFRTVDLEPGEYTFTVSADGYRDGECLVTVPAAGPSGPTTGTEQPAIDPVTGQPIAPAVDPVTGQPIPAQPAVDPVTGQPIPAQPAVDPVTGQPIPAQPAVDPVTGQPGQPGVPGPEAANVTVAPDGNLEIALECKLKGLPKVGNVVGTTADGETGQPVAGATVTIQDKLGRELKLTADGAGSFRFENVPPGPVKLFVEAPGYLRTMVEIDVEARQDVRARLVLNKRPETANVVVTYNEVKLKKKVHFEHDSATLLPDSMAIIEEAADVLRNAPQLLRIEIQGHTDNTGSPAYNKRLSQERADAVKEALVNLGVDASRLSTRGYGDEKPLVPNVSDMNRARNRRVQLIILEKAR